MSNPTLAGSDDTVAMHGSFTTFTMTPDWLLDHPGISAEAFRVWAIICSYVGKERTAFPKVATIAARLHKSRRSIFNYLNELEAAGALRRQEQYLQGGRRTSTMFTLAWAYPLLLDNPTPPAPKPSDIAGAAPCTSSGAAPCTSRTRSIDLDPYEPDPKEQNTRARVTHATRVRDASADADGVFSAGGILCAENATANDNDAGDDGALVGAAITPDARTPGLQMTLRNDGDDQHGTTVAGPIASGAQSDNAASDFAAFYAAYPRKVGLVAARKAWTKALKVAGGPEPIMAGLASATFSRDRKFIPHPSTWLNAGRWMDEPEPQARSGRGSKISPEFDRESPAFDANAWSDEAVAAFHDEISRNGASGGRNDRS